MFWELVDFLAFALFGPLRCPRCGRVLGVTLRSCPRCQPWRFTYAGDEGVDFHLDEIDRLRRAAKAATTGSPVVDALSDAGIDAVWSQMVPVRMTDAEYEEWCAAMDEIKGRPPGTTLEAGRTRCRASMTITGWPTRYCVEPKGHDGPHYAGDRHTWGVTWNAVDPDDYTGR